MGTPESEFPSSRNFKFPELQVHKNFKFPNFLFLKFK